MQASGGGRVDAAEVLSDLALLGGFGAFEAGVYMLRPELSLIAGGVLLMLWGYRVGVARAR